MFVERLLKNQLLLRGDKRQLSKLLQRKLNPNEIVRESPGNSMYVKQFYARKNRKNPYKVFSWNVQMSYRYLMVK